MLWLDNVSRKKEKQVRVKKSTPRTNLVLLGLNQKRTWLICNLEKDYQTMSSVNWHCTPSSVGTWNDFVREKGSRNIRWPLQVYLYLTGWGHCIYWVGNAAQAFHFQCLNWWIYELFTKRYPFRRYFDQWLLAARSVVLYDSAHENYIKAQADLTPPPPSTTPQLPYIDKLCYNF